MFDEFSKWGVIYKSGIIKVFYFVIKTYNGDHKKTRKGNKKIFY